MTTPIRTVFLLVALMLGTAACGAESPPEAADSADMAAPAPEAESETPMSDEGAEAAGGEEAHSEEGGEHSEGDEGREGGEHDEGGEGGEHEGESHSEEGEEGGEYIARADTWDAERRGVRLILTYDAARDAFVGTAENTTDARICAVRVEVHLGDGPELGPTEQIDVEGGQSIEVVLPADREAFENWTAHPETSAC